VLATKYNDDGRRIRIEEERRIRVEQTLAELRRFHESAVKRLAETERAIAKTESTMRELEAELKRAKSA
jgi:hypothetical protein